MSIVADGRPTSSQTSTKHSTTTRAVSTGHLSSSKTASTPSITRNVSSSISRTSSTTSTIQSSTATQSPSNTLTPGIMAAIAIPSLLLLTGIVVHLTLYFYKKKLRKKTSVMDVEVTPYIPTAQLHATRKPESPTTRSEALTSGESARSNANMLERVESGSEVSYSSLPPPYILGGSERGTSEIVEQSSVEELSREEILQRVHFDG